MLEEAAHQCVSWQRRGWPDLSMSVNVSARQLAEREAAPQRLLWASTGTKNPAFSDVKYVEALIGPHHGDQVWPHLRILALTFPGLSKSIDSGMTVAQAASPYVTSYAKILEQPIDSSSQASQYLQDPVVKKALQYQNPQEQKQGTPGIMPMYQFEQTLRQDPRWMKTNNARDQLGSAAYHVLSDFGLNPSSGGSSSGG